MSDELEWTEEKAQNVLTLSYQNRQEDLMTAIEAIEQKSREAARRTFHVMAVLLVGYWSVDLIIREPGFIFGWLMLVMTAVLAFVVLREPRAGNLKYTARYVERSPEGTVTVDESGFSFEDGTGRDPFRYADGLRVYEYKNVLALDGGKRRFAMIPLDQLSEADRNTLIEKARKAGNFEKLEPKQKTGGIFRK